MQVTHARPFVAVLLAAAAFGITAGIIFNSIPDGLFAGFGIAFVGIYLAAFFHPRAN